jgi:hypothetical protein
MFKTYFRKNPTAISNKIMEILNFEFKTVIEIHDHKIEKQQDEDNQLHERLMFDISLKGDTDTKRAYLPVTEIID